MIVQILALLGIIYCSVGLLPINKPVMISLKRNRSLNIFSDIDLFRIHNSHVFPPAENDKNVAKLYHSKNGYNVKFGTTYMCRTDDNKEVKACRSDKTSDEVVWEIITSGEGTRFKNKDYCLTGEEPDIEEGNLLLTTKLCENNLAQYFEIRELPIQQFDHESSSDYDFYDALKEVTSKNVDKHDN